MFWQGLIVCACAVLVLAEQRQSRIVLTTQGPVRGYRAREGHYEFFGVPYATAPTGPYKYRPPLPPPTWVLPFEAVNRSIMCPQKLFGGTVIDSEENCLIANIYVPDTRVTNLPVLVHLHGGAYQYGYGDMATGINLLNSNKVIIVNFNYRLGAHGFLCLGTEDVPGNAGSKDQVALLRWIQRNIRSFGGNPNDVTIHGYSAGASSADLILISKMGRGLFHKLILDSGANTASFSVQVDPLTNAKMIAKNLNFADVDDLEALEAFYKTATVEMLWSVDVVSSRNSSVIFSPCIERDLGQEIFLDDAPINILRGGDYPKVPMLIGIAEMEGIFRLNFFDQWKQIMNDRFSDFLPQDLSFPNILEREIVAQIVKQFYFGNEPVGEQTILDYIDYFTDVMFGYGTAKAVQLQVEGGNNQIYLYEYAFTDERDGYIPHTNIRGATHCAFTDTVLDERNEEQFLLGRRIMKAVVRDLYLNFVTTGRPVPVISLYPAWLPVLIQRTPYMSLNSTLALRTSFLGSRATLWDEIYRRYYNTPIAPSLS